MPVGSNWLGDDHPTQALRRAEGLASHRQATAQMAADRGWFWRSSPHGPLVPDTRRCVCHGEVLFTASDDVTYAPNPLSNASLGIL